MSRKDFIRRWSAPFAAGIVFGAALTQASAAIRGSAIFSDVPEGSYYDQAVGDMYDIGVIKGVDGKFLPGQFVTRADVAVMMQRLRNELTGNVSEQQSSSSRERASSATSRSSSSSSAGTNASVNPKGTIRFTTSAFTIPENYATHIMTISVVRTGGNQGTVSVDYEMAAGSAAAGSDFEIQSGTLTFENGDTSKTFTVKLLDDQNAEGNETFSITLKNPDNGVSLGAPSSATVTILDNESSSGVSSSRSSATSAGSSQTTLNLNASAYTVNENAGTMTVTIARSGPTNVASTVGYATSNGSATANEYTGASGTMSFANGETTKTFTVAIMNDTATDGAKTFNITLQNPTGGVLGATKTATVTINDDESVTFGSGSFRFAKATYSASENASVAITVQRTGGTQGTASVSYATLLGTAGPGIDYTNTAGTLTFLAGESAKIVLVPIIKDSNSDTGENFYMELTSPSSPTTLITPYSTTITIEE